MVARLQQTFVRDRFEQCERDAAAQRELFEGEELLGVFRVGREHSLREGLVGGVELTAHEPPDEREGQAPAAEVADAGEAVEVLGPVEAEAPLPAGRREQPALLVEADRVDRHVGLLRQLLDPPLRGHAAILGAITPKVPSGRRSPLGRH